MKWLIPSCLAFALILGGSAFLMQVNSQAPGAKSPEPVEAAVTADMLASGDQFAVQLPRGAGSVDKWFLDIRSQGGEDAKLAGEKDGRHSLHGVIAEKQKAGNRIVAWHERVIGTVLIVTVFWEK